MPVIQLNSFMIVRPRFLRGHIAGGASVPGAAVPQKGALSEPDFNGKPKASPPVSKGPEEFSEPSKKNKKKNKKKGPVAGAPHGVALMQRALAAVATSLCCNVQVQLWPPRD